MSKQTPKYKFIYVSERKNYQRRMHLTGSLINGEYTKCGKTSPRCDRTSEIKKVTCPICLELQTEK